MFQSQWGFGHWLSGARISHHTHSGENCTHWLFSDRLGTPRGIHDTVSLPIIIYTGRGNPLSQKTTQVWWVNTGYINANYLCNEIPKSGMSMKVRCWWYHMVRAPSFSLAISWLQYIQRGLRRIPLDGYLRGWIYYDRGLLSIAIHFNSSPCSIWGIMAYTKNAQLKNNSICVSYSSYFFSGFLFSLTKDICMKIRSYS